MSKLFGNFLFLDLNWTGFFSVTQTCGLILELPAVWVFSFWTLRLELWRIICFFIISFHELMSWRLTSVSYQIFPLSSFQCNVSFCWRWSTYSDVWTFCLSAKSLTFNTILHIAPIPYLLPCVVCWRLMAFQINIFYFFISSSAWFIVLLPSNRDLRHVYFCVLTRQTGN